MATPASADTAAMRPVVFINSRREVGEFEDSFMPRFSGDVPQDVNSRNPSGLVSFNDELCLRTGDARTQKALSTGGCNPVLSTCEVAYVLDEPRFHFLARHDC